jgi:hypothetical protein
LQGGQYFCGSSSTLAILFNQYYCDAGSCYACNATAHAVRSGDACVCDASAGYSQCGTGTSATCVNFQTDLNNCGGCGASNPAYICNPSTQTCANGQCISNVCSPGTTQPCYTGPSGTYTGTCPGPTCAPKGECKAGTQTCTAQGTWGTCNNQVLPATETCNNKDDNCNGVVDDGLSQQMSCGVGACIRTITQTCTAGNWGPTCTPGAPTTETCNGVDDNCNG